MDELQKRIKSFAYAFTGIGSFLRKEHNAWIHCIAIIIVTNDWLIWYLPIIIP